MDPHELKNYCKFIAKYEDKIYVKLKQGKQVSNARLLRKMEGCYNMKCLLHLVHCLCDVN